MIGKEDAVLFGPFVGEFYWEAGRFAPMLPYLIKDGNPPWNKAKFIVMTREERFDLYGQNADILVPMRIEGDYTEYRPDCFRLIGFTGTEYRKLADKFYQKYDKRFKILRHIYPDISKRKFDNKNQFPRAKMRYEFFPRKKNYELIDAYLPNDKPVVVLASRFRNGFKRNWQKWPDFYDLIVDNEYLMNNYTFVICGKQGEYRPDKKDRFHDINKIQLQEGSSLAGLLLVVLERAHFTFGSQSAIPNISLLYGVEVLEFGCQESFHTKTYNVKNTPITFITNPNYNIEPKEVLNKLIELLKKKEKKNA
jgi:hypothetical protein